MNEKDEEEVERRLREFSEEKKESQLCGKCDTFYYKGETCKCKPMEQLKKPKGNNDD